jgi:competence protein ComEC
VGEHNRFGFPHQTVQARYEAAGCHLLRTDRDGQITFRTDGQSLKVKTFR